MSDEVIRELWRIKEDIAREFNYDVYALAAEMRRQDRESGEDSVDLSRHTAEQQATGSQNLRPKT